MLFSIILYLIVLHELYFLFNYITGVICNWFGVANNYLEPLRYIGVGLVLVGSFLIISAMCRWIFISPETAVSEVSNF